MGSESSGFEKARGDVVAEVAEAERGAVEVFEASVDRLGRAVVGAGAIEEREDVRGALLEGAAESADLDQRGRNTAGDAVDHGLHHRLAAVLVGFSVGGDDALVDAPGRFDFDMLVGSEQNTLRTQAVATIASGASATYTVPTSGWYYHIYNCTAGTVFTPIQNASSTAQLMAVPPIVTGTSETISTGPPAFAKTFQALAAGAKISYVPSTRIRPAQPVAASAGTTRTRQSRTSIPSSASRITARSATGSRMTVSRSSRRTPLR